MENITYSELLKISDALESGKYKQSFGALRNKDGYCVEGVACDVVLGDFWRTDGERYLFDIGPRPFYAFAPNFIGWPLALSLSVFSASIVNDSEKASFPIMAKRIRDFVNTRIKDGSKLWESVS